MRSRTVGRWIGLAAGILGLGGWVLALSVASAMSSLGPRTVIFLAAMLLAIGGVTVSAYQYNDRGRAIWHSLLVVATFLLVFGTVLSGFSVGYLFLPAAIAAMAATLFTFLSRAARTL
jgi:hypothetical protein